MKNRKNLLEEEPVWKKKRREELRQVRIHQIWLACLIIAAVAVVVLMSYRYILVNNAPAKAKNDGNPSHKGIARVMDKVTDQSSGKVKYTVVFSILGGQTRWDVDRKIFDSIQKGQKGVLSYDIDEITGRPTRIYGWEKIKQ